MQTMKIGPFLLNMQIVLYLLFGIAALLAVRLYLKKDPDRGAVFSSLENAFLIWILVWKGSVLVFDPLSVIRYPMSLLYFTAGEKGIWLAWAAAGGYMWARIARRKHSFQAAAPAMAAGLLAGWTVYSVLQAWLQPEQLLPYVLQAALAGALLLSLVGGRLSPVNKSLLSRGLWLSLGQTAILFTVTVREPVLLSFSKEQLLLLLAAAGILIMMRKPDEDR
ncbi:hypothetical protein [Paenibacillus lutrae]|uniref:Prolipoprotein diacylglyceryl transferase n=1 Tax=Paenibacillus lutrae TaxID=2078573 RepID=A0A7X3JY80_9BACL|nr:hypothetical protein [Paenibacillus lutrae]MVO98776.1 hypothetical protein [Paenibacillus lutrae]